MTRLGPAARIRRPVLPIALLAVVATAASCSVVRGLQTPNRGAPATARTDTTRMDTLTVDTAALDTLAVDTLRPAAAPDSVSRRDSAADAAPRDAPPADSTPAADSAEAGRADADSLLPEGYPTAAELEERGPTYTPYAIGPQLLPGEWLSDLLSDTLAPVVDRHDALSVQTDALFWVLVDRDGRVRDAVVHTSSESEAFDRAARVVANRLRYRPAVFEGQAVPVWVLARVSLLMR